MDIKILGSGCTKCNKLEENTKKALLELHLDATIEKVTDFEKITAYGVMTTPALVVNGDVKSSGRLLSPKEIIKLL